MYCRSGAGQHLLQRWRVHAAATEGTGCDTGAPSARSEPPIELTVVAAMNVRRVNGDQPGEGEPCWRQVIAVLPAQTKEMVPSSRSIPGDQVSLSLSSSM